VIKVDLFIPCFVDQFKPDIAFNMIKVLEKAGCQANYNVEQTCCGLPAFNAGNWEDARTVGEKLLTEVNSDRNLVSGAASCTAMIRNSYDLLFQNSSFHNKYRQLQKKTFELSEFLVDVLKVTQLGSRFQGKVTYMDSCHALNHCRISEQPRTLLSNVEGLELVEIKKGDECCGFGGVFATMFEPISVKMAQNKIDNVLESGAKYIVSTDYTCLIHLDSYIKKQNINLEVLHLADVLASGL